MTQVALGAATNYWGIAQWAAKTNTVEANVQAKSSAGAYDTLTRYISASTLGTATLRFRKNGANGNQIVSAASGATGWFQDAVNKDTAADSDLVCLQDVTTGTITGSGILSMRYIDNITVTTLTGGGFGTSGLGSTSSFSPLGSTTTFTTPETSFRSLMGAAGSMQRLRGIAASNFQLQMSKNAVVGTLICTQTTPEDTTHADAILAGDFVSCNIAAGSWRLDDGWTVRIVSSGNDFDCGCNTVYANGGTTSYVGIMGGVTQVTTEANMQMMSPDYFTWHKARFFVNSYGGGASAATFKSRINGAYGSQVCSASGGATGWFSDATNSDTINPGDRIDFEFASNGNTQINHTGSTLGRTSNSNNRYVSSAAWEAVSQWAPATTYKVGQYRRQLGDLRYAGWSGFGAGSADTVTFNFGGTSFTGAVPTGYTAYGATATLDPAKDGAGITLSGGNLTASRASASAWSTVLATLGKTTGKWYWEATIGSLSGSSNQSVGIGLSTMNLASFLGDYTTVFGSMGYQSSGVLTNISSGYTFATYASSSLICFAWDVDKATIFFRIGASGTWNNSTPGDPVNFRCGINFGSFLSNVANGSSISMDSQRVFKCTTAGTSGASEPAWNLGDNATTTDNTATWTQIAGQEAEQSTSSWEAPLPGFAAVQNLALTPTNLFASSDHREIQSINEALAITPGGLFSVSRTGMATVPPGDANLAFGAQYQTGGTNSCTAKIQEVYGIDMACSLSNSAANLTIGNGTSSFGFRFDRCRFNTFGTSTTNRFHIGGGSIADNDLWYPTIGDLALTQIVCDSLGVTELHYLQASSFQHNTSVFAIAADSDSPKVRFRGCDFTAATNTLDPGLSTGKATGGLWEFFDCKLPPNDPFNGNGTTYDITNEYRFWNCENGGNTTYKLWQRTGSGDLISRGDIAKNGGMNDGTSSFCWEFSQCRGGTFNNSFGHPHRAPSLMANATAGARTAVVYLCSTIALTNAQFWIDLETLDDSADTFGAIHTTRLKASISTAAAVALTADTSGWDTTPSARANLHAYAVGDVLKVASNSGRAFVCTTAGTSAAAEPGGYATAVDGGTVIDGTATMTAVIRYSVTFTWTAGRPGIVRAFCHFVPGSTAASTRIFVDPVLYVT